MPFIKDGFIGINRGCGFTMVPTYLQSTKRKGNKRRDASNYTGRFYQFMYDGYVFFCNKISQQQCLSNKSYTCADQKTKPPEEKIKVGSIIFLYNADDQTLLGPFTALAEESELDAGAWAMNVDEHIPSEDIKVTWEDLHIIQNAAEKLPFLKNLKTCRLTALETQNALDTLKQGELYLYAENKK